MKGMNSNFNNRNVLQNSHPFPNQGRNNLFPFNPPTQSSFPQINAFQQIQQLQHQLQQLQQLQQQLQSGNSIPSSSSFNLFQPPPSSSSFMVTSLNTSFSPTTNGPTIQPSVPYPQQQITFNNPYALVTFF